MGTMLQVVCLALRSFLRKPGFFAVALATLALGIGATAAIFKRGLVEGMLFGISPTEPLTYAFVAGVLIATTALASLAPRAPRGARRPLVTMRAE